MLETSALSALSALHAHHHARVCALCVRCFLLNFFGILSLVYFYVFIEIAHRSLSLYVYESGCWVLFPPDAPRTCVLFDTRCMCENACVSVCVSVFLCVFLCVCVCFCVFMCVCVCVSVHCGYPPCVVFASSSSRRDTHTHARVFCSFSLVCAALFMLDSRGLISRSSL